MEFDVYSVLLIVLVVPLANLFWRWVAGLISNVGHPVAQSVAAGLATAA